MRFSPKRRIYLDSPDLTMAENNTVEHDAALSAPEGAEKPQNAFAAKLVQVMDFEEFVSISELVERVNKRLTARNLPPIDEQYVRNLRSAGLKKATSAKRKDAIAEIAAVLNRTLAQLFTPVSQSTPEATDEGDEPDVALLLEWCQEGLVGPKRHFLADCIELAYTAKVLNRERPRKLG